MRIGVDLGGNDIRVAVISDGHILKKIVEPKKESDSEDEVVDHLLSTIGRIMNSNIRGVGVGVPSLVDTERGVVYNVNNIPAWKEVQLKDIVEQEYKVPTVINNEYNCLAIGEHKYGVASAYSNAVCISMGNELGAGIIINNHLYEGYNAAAGQIGDLPYLDGTFGDYCSSKFFKNQYGTTDQVAISAAREGGIDAMEQWDKFGEHFGNLMQAILFTYDPQAVIMNGSLAQAYNFFLKGMNRSLQKFPSQKIVKRVRFLLSQREDIALLGAGALVN